MPEDNPGSITRWVAGLKGGDLAAVQPLSERNRARMVELARADAGVFAPRTISWPR